MKKSTTYEDLVEIIIENYDNFSKKNQQIARFLMQNPNDLAINSIPTVAKKCDAHPSSLVRFAQSLGFKGFKDLQALFQQRLVTAAPGFEARIAALETELSLSADGSLKGFLQDLVIRDIASLHALLDDIPEELLQRTVAHLESARTIYIAGQLRSEPIAIFLRYVLTMLRRHVVLLDGAGGLSAEMAKNMGPDDVLIAVSFRFYASEVMRIAEIAAQNATPVIALTDGPLSPLAKATELVYSVPEDENLFSRSLAAPICLAQALAVALASRLHPTPGTAPKIPVVTAPRSP